MIPTPSPDDPIKVRRILAFLMLCLAVPSIFALAALMIAYGLPEAFACEALGIIGGAQGMAWQAYLSAAKRMEK